jgi:hypothetical protein
VMLGLMWQISFLGNLANLWAVCQDTQIAAVYPMKRPMFPLFYILLHIY